MNAIMEYKAEKSFEFDFEMIIDVSPDSNNGLFRRYHVGGNPVNFVDPMGLFPWKTPFKYTYKLLKRALKQYRSECNNTVSGITLDIVMGTGAFVAGKAEASLGVGLGILNIGEDFITGGLGVWNDVALVAVSGVAIYDGTQLMKEGAEDIANLIARLAQRDNEDFDKNQCGCPGE